MTPAEADALFAAMAALGDRIAFRYIVEGCECRSQLMIEAMAAAGIIPGRVWALTMPGKVLRPANLPRGRTTRWLNHTAPTVVVDATPEGVRVIDPSLPG